MYMYMYIVVSTCSYGLGCHGFLDCYGLPIIYMYLLIRPLRRSISEITDLQLTTRLIYLLQLSNLHVAYGNFTVLMVQNSTQ